jgi:hypothetical protein
MSSSACRISSATHCAALSNLARVAANKRRPGRIEIAARKWPNIDEYSGHYGPVAECSQFILHVLGLICYD